MASRADKMKRRGPRPDCLADFAVHSEKRYAHPHLSPSTFIRVPAFTMLWAESVKTLSCNTVNAGTLLPHFTNVLVLERGDGRRGGEVCARDVAGAAAGRFRYFYLTHQTQSSLE